jgi:hypothetical protein
MYCIHAYFIASQNPGSFLRELCVVQGREGYDTRVVCCSEGGMGTTRDLCVVRGGRGTTRELCGVQRREGYDTRVVCCSGVGGVRHESFLLFRGREGYDTRMMAA